MVERSVENNVVCNRSQRLQMTFEVDLGNAIELKSLPFVVGVLGDFTGTPEKSREPFKDRRFIEIDRDHFDWVLSGQSPQLTYQVENVLSANSDSMLNVELKFESMDDFCPEAVARQVPALKALVTQRELLKNMTAQRVDTVTLDELSQQRRDNGDFDLRNSLAKEIGGDNSVVAKAVPIKVDAFIAEIDQWISSQLRLVIHHADFKNLEASWRGLHYLVHQSKTRDNLKIKLLNVSKKGLLRDFDIAAEFDHTVLFKHVYGNEYDAFGGHPFGCLIGDYEFGREREDIALLDHISGVAAVAHVPFLAAAKSPFSNLEANTDFRELLDFELIRSEVNPGAQESAADDSEKLDIDADVDEAQQRFDELEYEKSRWKSFREGDDSRYIGLTVPKILLRLPYGSESNPVEAFNFEENAGGVAKKNSLWGNAAYALAARLTDTFSRFGLPAIGGVEGGEIVRELPVSTFATDDGQIVTNCSVDVALSDRQVKDLSDLGFIPLKHCQETGYSVFLATQSCHKVIKSDNPEETLRRRVLSFDLQSLFCVSRFVHYLRSITRHKTFTKRDECQAWLNQWLNHYTLENSATACVMENTEKPLRSGRIEVRKDDSRQGCFLAVIYLDPHFPIGRPNLPLAPQIGTIPLPESCLIC